MPYKSVFSDAEFNEVFQTVGPKPLIAMFSGEHCQPCKMITPTFSSLSDMYGGQAVFAKIETGKCPVTSRTYNITGVPTFHVFSNGKIVETKSGADQDGLRALCETWAKSSTPCEVPGQYDLTGFISLAGLEGANICDDKPIRDFIKGDIPLIRSDCDEQIIVTIPFNQNVKLHTLFVKGPPETAPKTIRIFSNVTRTLDFDDVQGMEAVQVIELTEEATKDGEYVPLRFVKFQNVHTVQFFIENNQGGGEVTELSALRLIGTPVAGMRMSDFQNVFKKEKS